MVDAEKPEVDSRDKGKHKKHTERNDLSSKLRLHSANRRRCQLIAKLISLVCK